VKVRAGFSEKGQGRSPRKWAREGLSFLFFCVAKALRDDLQLLLPSTTQFAIFFVQDET
jgi:hypothetical protein